MPLRAWWSGLRTRLTIDQLPSLLFALWAATFVLRAHYGYVRQPYQHNVDEGYLLAIGQRMLHGHMLPFVDGVAHSGPVFLYTGAWIAWFGEFSWLPIRVAAALCFTAMTWLTYAVGRRAGNAFAGALGAAAIPLFCVLRFGPVDGIAYNAEVPVNLFALLALLVVLRVPQLPRAKLARWVVSAGALGALAPLSKQTALLHLGVLTGALGLLTSTREDASRALFRRVAAWFALGIAVPLVPLLGWFAAHRALGDLLYYVSTYNRAIYMHYATSHWEYLCSWMAARPTELTLTLATLLFGATRPFVERAQVRDFRQALARAAFPLIVTAFALAGLIGARAAQREFDHYFVLTLPWFGLLAGMIVDTTCQHLRARSLLAVRALIMVPLAILFELSWASRGTTLLGWSWDTGTVLPLTQLVAPHPLCAHIRAHTRQDQTTFVWGFRPELYITCGRRPASRFVFTSFVAGFIPWYFTMSKGDEDMLAVPGSRALLIRELEQNQPPVIIDAGRSMANRSMQRYDELDDYLDAHYTLAEKLGEDRVYRRNGGAAPAAR